MPARAPLRYWLYQGLWTGLDWLYPPECGGCGARGERWCPKCQAATQVIRPPFCERCGQPQPAPGECERCRSFPPRFSAMRSWAIFAGPLREALLHLKYRRDLGLGEALARPLIRLFDELDWTVDIVVPVPLGVARQQERGYNQAALIARPLALGCGLALRSQALVRKRETRSQVGLTYAQRRENVGGAFQSQSQWVEDRRVLLVDDVATSSATLDACAAALLASGARQVFGLTVARAVFRRCDALDGLLV